MPDVLVDAGALIAVLDRDDRAHAAAVDALGVIRGRLVTAWPAIAEAMHLLGPSPPAQEALLDMIEDAVLTIAPLDQEDVPRMKALMRKYRDTPMDFADAALVRIAEREQVHRILTFDAHFRVYALPRRRRFVVIPSAAQPPGR